MVAVLPSSRDGFDLDAAYAVEAALKREREAAGHRATGRKVGYANKALWRMLKLETLVWAHMYDDTVRQSTGNSCTLTLPNSRSLKVEPEIVFGLRQPLAAAGVDASGALQATEWLAIGFEIIDCPFAGWQFQPSDFVASFGLHAALVIGERFPVHSDAVARLAEELPRLKVRISKNGEFVEEGFGKNALRSPPSCLAELVNAILRRFPAEPLAAGEIISSGTLTAGHLTEGGDEWRVEVEGLDLPALTLRVA